jgi:hypothetical protein
MEKYKVKVKVEFIGDFFVQANSSIEARQIVEQNAFVMRGEIGAGTKNIFKDEKATGIYDWEWPSHADTKKIISISKP